MLVNKEVDGRLFLAMLSELRWEFALICVVRFCLGLATLAEPQAVYYVLVLTEKKDVSFSTRCSVFSFAVAAFSCTPVRISFTSFCSYWLINFQFLRQMVTRLMNRFSTLIRAVISGQVLAKSTRLKVDDAMAQDPGSLIDREVREIGNSLQKTFEIIASAVELGGLVSSLWQHVGRVSFTVFIPSARE